MGLTFFQGKADFYFYNFQFFTRQYGVPKGSRHYPPVTLNFKNIKYITNYQHVIFMLANSSSLLSHSGKISII